VAATVSISGGSKVDVTVYGRGTVIAGNGNDSIDITGRGKIIVGSGHDTLTLGKGGEIWQVGASGVDTINMGGHCGTLHEQGTAVVSGDWGQVTISGGVLQIEGHGDHPHDSHGKSHGQAPVHSGDFYKEIAVSGNLTLQGGAANSEYVGGSGTTFMPGGSGNDTFIGGSGHDTMVGGTGHDVFAFNADAAGGHHVIQNFVSGHDQLFIEGHSLDYLMSHHDITTSGGNTYIAIDGGKTTIELQGVTSLKASDITTHHPH
jgi:Ca2+-binding RTX toxin-like protein